MLTGGNHNPVFGPGRTLRALICAALLAYSSSGAIDSSLVSEQPQPKAEITMSRANGQLIIRGVISSEGSREILQGVRSTHFNSDQAGFDVYVTSPLPPRWSLIAETTLTSLAGVPWFEASIRADKISIQGILNDPEQADAIRHALEYAVPKGVGIHLDFLTISAAKSIQELCQERFAALTDNRRITFTASTEDLGLSATGVLDALLEIAIDCPTAQFVIVGHTDSRGDEAANIVLSQRRAAAAAAYLVGRGMGENRLQVKGAGSAQPVADNSSALGRNSNRRLELIMNFESDSPKSLTSMTGSGLH